MKLHLIINKKLPPYISQAIGFLNKNLADEHIKVNQKHIDNQPLLSMHIIDLIGELSHNQKMIYVLFDYNNNANYSHNFVPGIKRSKHIQGFYAHEDELYQAQTNLPLIHNKKFCEIHYLPIVDLDYNYGYTKPKKNSHRN